MLFYVYFDMLYDRKNQYCITNHPNTTSQIEHTTSTHQHNIHQQAQSSNTSYHTTSRKLKLKHSIPWAQTSHHMSLKLNKKSSLKHHVIFYHIISMTYEQACCILTYQICFRCGIHMPIIHPSPSHLLSPGFR